MDLWAEQHEQGIEFSTGLSNLVAGFPGRDDSCETQRLGEKFVHILLSQIFVQWLYAWAIYCYEYLTVNTLWSADEAIVTAGWDS